MRNRRHTNIYDNNSIIVHDKDQRHINNAYEKLKDNILFASIGGRLKVIQVESSTSFEGKTTLVSNLAVSLADNNKKVLVIDLDLRKPRVHRCFGILNKSGICDYLLGNITLDNLVVHTEFNVDVITRGLQIDNPSLILTSNKLSELVEHFKPLYDYIIVDCPPVLVATDYIHISRFTDGILFCVAYGVTKRTEVTDAIKELRKSQLNIIGSVFTFYDEDKADYYEYKNYSSHYYEYYDNNTSVDDK